MRRHVVDRIWMPGNVKAVIRRLEPTLVCQRQLAEIEALQTFQCIV
jgi:hypothetical protein